MRSQTAQCIVSSSIARSLAALLFLPGLFLALHLRWVVFGHVHLLDFSHFLRPNDQPSWKALLGFVCLIVFVLRYIPHSVRTLLGGKCALATRRDAILLYGKTSVPTAEIESIVGVRGIFRKGLLISTSRQGTRYVSTIMSKHPDPGPNLAALQRALGKSSPQLSTLSCH